MESSTIFAGSPSVNASVPPTPVILGAELTPIKLVTADDGDVPSSIIQETVRVRGFGPAPLRFW